MIIYNQVVPTELQVRGSHHDGAILRGGSRMAVVRVGGTCLEIPKA